MGGIGGRFQNILKRIFMGDDLNLGKTLKNICG